MIVTNPEPSSPTHSSRRVDPAQRRLETQERRRRLAVAYGVAVTGYPRGGDENVYALPGRYSATAARVDDPILVHTYRTISDLRERLGSASAAQQKAAAREMAELVGRLRLGQRRYLAQQMLTRGPPPQGSVCGVCYDQMDAEATILPCSHTFHEACIQATLDQEATCSCTVCKRDLTLAALLHDAMADCTGSQDADALWKSLPLADVPVNTSARPLTPPMGGPAPALAAVKESWRAKINTAYDNDPTTPAATPTSATTHITKPGAASKDRKDRAWQLDADLRRLEYTTPQTLRDRVNVVYDVARALHTAGWNERYRRAMAFLDKQRARASTNANGPLDLKHRCAVCETPIAASETSSPPCKHLVHSECWPSWFQKQRHTQCPTCHRDVAIYACMESMAAPDGLKGVETMKELWLTVEEVYF